MLPIAALPITQRPREKLLRLGATALSLPELAAVIIGSGTHKTGVHILSEKLARCLRTADTSNWNWLPTQTRARLLAALELGKRVYLATVEPVLSPAVAIAQFPQLRTAKKEMIAGLYLDSRLRIVHREVLAMGSLNQSLIQPRDIFLPLRDHPDVSSLLLLHNHPSGDPTPSKEDLQFTAQVRQACELLGLTLEDHIVVAEDRWVSLCEKGK